MKAMPFSGGLGNPSHGRLPVWRSSRTVFWLLLLLLAAICDSCFDPHEGCLDIAATNFNASADKNCCCRYPELVLTVNQSYDTLLFRNDSLYPGDGGHLFRVKSIVFYLSDFQFFRGNEPFLMGDSISLKTRSANGDTVSRTFIDDFVLVRRSPVQYPVAAFREDGYFDKLQFRLGLPADAEKVIPALAPANHALYPKTENLYDGNFVWLQAVVVRDSMSTTLPDTLRFKSADLGTFLISGTGNFNHKVGYDFPMTLNADWSKMFEGIDWTVHDTGAWKSRIVANMPSVFSVSQ